MCLRRLVSTAAAVASAARVHIPAADSAIRSTALSPPPGGPADAAGAGAVARDLLGAGLAPGLLGGALGGRVAAGGAGAAAGDPAGALSRS